MQPLIGQTELLHGHIDLADAYHTVPVALSDQKYLVFNFEGQLYKYV